MSESLESAVDPAAPTEAELESFESESSNPTPAPQESQAQAPKSAEQKAVEKLEKEFLLKVNGKEIKEKIDLNDEQRIIKALQMEKAANEAFSKAAAKEKEITAINQQLDQFFELLKSNPLQVLMNPELGLNAEELANKILDMKIEEEMKDPKEKALEEAKAKLAEYEKKEAEAKAEADKLRLEKMEKEIADEMNNAITKAIDGGDLPKSPYIINKFGQLMDAALSHGVDVSADELIPIVKAAYIRDMKEMIGKLPDEVIEDMVTPDRVKGIRNKRIQAVREANAKASQSVKVEDTASAPAKNEPKKQAKENFFKKLGDW